ncbi:DUF2865 domain-containing protein [Hoeflea prorocentri]|uniref:DUF2865 domain-containing protein n=1 Tax=Hoeflea prorocentri TaxID=1922333 RepID=A0A9X3ZGY4_9HYPH|nr:DUF2865 domain-containing protein [Hoeflea prorocentri]MCY6380311.1 DUF2865 domain-containing protein [Hoeflea prorocentri]MDA5398111.1 DUF2865 domain-containing protein [Hoeflea prorocentri]
MKLTGPGLRHVLVLAAMLSVSFGERATAQDMALCERLYAQLDQYDSREIAAVPANSYDAAIVEQRQKVEQIRSDLYSLDCGGSIIVFGNRTEAMCRRISSVLAREEAQLDRLLLQRQNAPRTASPGARQRILSALRANGCPPDDGVRIRQSIGVEPEQDLIDLGDPYTRYRTMCVRTCDGYYFPVSFSASPLEFDRDARRCATMCPAADVSLFFHRVPDQDSEDMVSVADQTPYRSLPTAFAYRTGSVDDPQCTCRAGPLDDDIAVAPGGSRSIIIITPPKDNDDKPDETVTIKPEPEAPSREIDPNRRVRVVGPKFLPDQSEAIDLQAPAPTGDQ